MGVVSIKLTNEQRQAIERYVRKRGFPSKSEFLRYAIMRTLEEDLSVETLDEVFTARRQVRQGRTVPLDTLLKEK